MTLSMVREDPKKIQKQIDDQEGIYGDGSGLGTTDGPAESIDIDEEYKAVVGNTREGKSLNIAEEIDEDEESIHHASDDAAATDLELIERKDMRKSAGK